ncbi:prespore-specific regulator [Scopulibacillus daqui]|uniref:Prespore-specific regulator n=1 Tax=Scopulibacillus daqui TaxID=1469162 RepID=A0ABS2Q0P7_9BACL|nr:RsfA family transcriptional regulator [Scopulibacillus daqui]MBM7645867.1 prespore-specific regulator [Scopulibacillus daqui]
MTKVRQDAWSHEDDLLLAETVLRHIREGSTQLDAFEEVGDKLNRTGAACGFRWNAIVRKKYEQAIEIAKKQRKQRKRAEQQRVRNWQKPQMGTTMVHPSADFDSSLPASPSQTKPLTLDDVISFLENLQNHDRTNQKVIKENERLRQENEELRSKVNELEKQLDKLEKNHKIIEEDYQSLMSIMDRARRMVAFQDQEEPAGPTFKMDKNGNLEKIAK